MPAPAQSHSPAGPTAPGRFGLGDAIVLGLSSSGPAQTLAVSLAALVATCSFGGPLPVLLCFFPMLGIALAYQRLNVWDPRAGATYSWVARVFHPYLGFLSGWMILLYYTLGTSSLTIPAGTYTLALIDDRLIENPLAEPEEIVEVPHFAATSPRCEFLCDRFLYGRHRERWQCELVSFVNWKRNWRGHLRRQPQWARRQFKLRGDGGLAQWRVEAQHCSQGLSSSDDEPHSVVLRTVQSFNDKLRGGNVRCGEI